MNRTGRLITTLAVSNLIAFGLGGWVALDNERSKTQNTAAATSSQPPRPEPYQPTETKIIHKTVTKTVTVNELSDDCRKLLDRTGELYDALFTFNVAKADIQTLLDSIGSAIVRVDKPELNKAHEKIRELDDTVMHSLHKISQAEYSAQHYRERCPA